MSEIDTGGPAFPYRAYSGIPEPGMTLRDYFAAKAMQALLERRGDGALGVFEKEEVAEESYIMADALLKERNK